MFEFLFWKVSRFLIWVLPGLVVRLVTAGSSGRTWFLKKADEPFMPGHHRTAWEPLRSVSGLGRKAAERESGQTRLVRARGEDD